MTAAPRDPSKVELHNAYQEYRRAMSSWRAASKAESILAAETAADRLLQARVALYRSLLATGWQPPPAVTVQLERDAALLEAPQDFDALLAV